MFKHLLLSGLLSFAAMSAFVSAEENPAEKAKAEVVASGPALPDAEVDKTLNALIEKHKQLKYFTADLKQTKSGGVFKRPEEEAGKLFVTLPGNVFIDLSNHGKRIICDGKFAWLLDLDFNDVERWGLEGEGSAEAGKKMDVSAFFLGTDVKTAEEFRKEFDIIGVKAKGGDRFLMLPRNEKLREKTAFIDIILPEGAFLPAYVRSSAPKKETGAPLVTEQWLTNAHSNLDGGAEPDKSVYVFKPTKDMTFRAMPENRELTIEEALQGETQKGKE